MNRDHEPKPKTTANQPKAVINELQDLYQLQAKLLYGTGMRIKECLRLRVQDIDFEMNQITIRDAKGSRLFYRAHEVRCKHFVRSAEEIVHTTLETLDSKPGFVKYNVYEVRLA